MRRQRRYKVRRRVEEGEKNIVTREMAERELRHRAGDWVWNPKGLSEDEFVRSKEHLIQSVIGRDLD